MLIGKTATISGWGKTNKENYARYLQKTQVEIGEDSFAKNVVRFFHRTAHGSCAGDSGGKHFLNQPLPD